MLMLLVKLQLIDEIFGIHVPSDNSLKHCINSFFLYFQKLRPESQRRTHQQVDNMSQRAGGAAGRRILPPFITSRVLVVIKISKQGLFAG